MNINNLLLEKTEKKDLYDALCLNEHEASSLFSLADTVRKEYCGDTVHIRGLLEISNICLRNCNYCGVRKDNKNVCRYKMPTEEIYDVALKINSLGYKTIVMQSGESKTYSSGEISELIYNIKKNTDLAVTLSFGECSYDDYKLWKEAGADRYLLRHETADREHFKFLHPDAVLETRLNCLNNLKKLNYETGIGGMIESPGQTLECLVKDLEFIRDFRPKMVGMGPYIVHKQTPFKDYKNGSVFMTLKMLALARIITKNAYMPATTALGSISNDGYKKGLQVGCNVIMINCTPMKYRKFYEIYENKKCISENSETILKEIKELIQSCGRESL